MTTNTSHTSPTTTATKVTTSHSQSYRRHTQVTSKTHALMAFSIHPTTTSITRQHQLFHGNQGLQPPITPATNPTTKSIVTNIRQNTDKRKQLNLMSCKKSY